MFKESVLCVFLHAPGFSSPSPKVGLRTKSLAIDPLPRPRIGLDPSPSLKSRSFQQTTCATFGLNAKHYLLWPLKNIRLVKRFFNFLRLVFSKILLRLDKFQAGIGFLNCNKWGSLLESVYSCIVIYEMPFCAVFWKCGWV